MRKQILLFTLASLIASNSYIIAQGLTVSGLLDSSFYLRAWDEKASLSIEEYANLRMQAKLRDRAVFYGAFNFIAAAGDYAGAAAGMGFNSVGENYIAGIELERLYFRLNFEAADFDGGLMRLPFGYGQIWGPSDFLNPKNPITPDARPRAILGAGLFLYPNDEIKLLGFGTAPRDPWSLNAEGWLTGLSMDWHFDRASIQALYSFESPNTDSNQGIHRAGLSVKADVEVGLVMDALYTYNHEAGTKEDGLSFSAGVDYSFFDGDLIVLAEYLYNGETSSTALGYGGSFSNEHYLYTSLTWRFNDYTNISAALISSFDDVSFMPVIALNHDLFQGATLTLTAQIPLDRDLFYGDGKRGELGPFRNSSYFNFNAKLRLRF